MALMVVSMMHPRKGKKYEEIYGKEKAKDIKIKLSNAHRGKKLSKEHRKHISVSLKGRVVWNKGLTKEIDSRIVKMAAKKKGKTQSKETKEKIRLAIMKKGLHKILEEYRKKYPPWNKGLTTKTDERIKKYVKKWKEWNKKYRKTIPVWNKGLTKENDSRIAKVARMKTGKRCAEKTKKKISKTLSEKWKDENFVKVILKKMYKKPNNLESFFAYILCEEGLPYRYVGDGTISIDGKCPDFINNNGKKKIIELFGDFYHKAEDENNRKKFFNRCGYDTLVIWEHEIKTDLVGVISKVKRFTDTQGLG